MGKYISRRILQALLVIFLVTIIAFLLMSVLPGDAAITILGIDAADTEKLQMMREKLGLDKPLWEQYWTWFVHMLQGNFGDSYHYNRTVSDLLSDRIPVTFCLGLVSLAVSFVVGILLGIVAAVHRNKPIDSVINVLANIGASAPQFWICVLFIFLFASKLDLLPTQGYVAPGEDFGAFVQHMIMPVMVMSLPTISMMTRQTRAAMLDVIHEDFVRTARSKGLPEKVILYKHILRNALIPLLTLLGLSVGSLFAGSVLVEQIYNIPGMGQLIVTSVMNRDTPIIQAVVVIMATVITLTTLVVDIVYALVDPRIRVSGAAK